MTETLNTGILKRTRSLRPGDTRISGITSPATLDRKVGQCVSGVGEEAHETWPTIFRVTLLKRISRRHVTPIYVFGQRSYPHENGNFPGDYRCTTRIADDGILYLRRGSSPWDRGSNLLLSRRFHQGRINWFRKPALCRTLFATLRFL